MDTFQGIPLFIEYAKGDTRTGTNGRGEPWSRLMGADYGYVDDGSTTVGDGEPLDVYVGEDEASDTMWMVEQLDEDGEHDEWKCMLGFPDRASAIRMYLKHYPKGWEQTHVNDVIEMPVSDLKQEIKSHTVSKNASVGLLYLGGLYGV